MVNFVGSTPTHYRLFWSNANTLEWPIMTTIGHIRHWLMLVSMCRFYEFFPINNHFYTTINNSITITYKRHKERYVWPIFLLIHKYPMWAFLPPARKISEKIIFWFIFVLKYSKNVILCRIIDYAGKRW